MIKCTPEQIEEKRRLAQQKLLAKKNVQNGSPVAQNSCNILSSDYNVVHATSDIFNQHSSTTATQGSPKHFNFKPYEKPKQSLPFKEKNSVVTGSCYLVSEDRFAIDLSEYSSLAISVFKTIPTRSYSKDRFTAIDTLKFITVGTYFQIRKPENGIFM